VPEHWCLRRPLPRRQASNLTRRREATFSDA
jgi:hypothetical protein